MMARGAGRRLGRRDVLKYSAAAGIAGAAGLGWSPRPAHAAEPVNFFTWSAGIEQVKSHITAFERKTGLKVEYANAPWAQYRETLITKFVGNAPIDTLWVSDSWLPEWADAGWLQPIDDIPALTKYNAEASDFCNQSMMHKGRQYGLTYYADYMAFLYDEEMLKKAGIAAPPASWDEVIEQSLKIKKAGLSEYPMLLPLALETWQIEYISAMVFSQGGRLVDDAGKAVMANPKGGAVQALQWIVDAVNTHKIASPGSVETGELAALKAFSAGTHAFALIPKYRMRHMNDPSQSQIAGRVKQALMPRGKDGAHATVGWMRFYGMTKRARANKERMEATAKLIEWFGGRADGEYKFQKILFLDLGAAFGVKPLFQDAEIRAALAKYSDPVMTERQQATAMKKDVISAWFGEWNEVNGVAWQQAILKKASVEDALKKSAATWDKLKKEAG